MHRFHAPFDHVFNALKNEQSTISNGLSLAVPRLETLFTRLVASIPFTDDYPLRILDLGAENGRLSALILDRYPNATATLIESDTELCLEAEKLLAQFGDRGVVRGDSFMLADLPREQDLLVSAFQLSSLDGIQRRSVFRAAYGALRGNGLLRFVDRFRGPTENLEKSYETSWKSAASEIDPVLFATIAQSYAAQSGMWIGNEITWLDRIGFRDVDIFWKDDGFALIGARKPVAVDFNPKVRSSKN